MRIVYFDIDSLRPDHLGCYGYDRPTSPNIDGLARSGTVFLNMLATQGLGHPVTLARGVTAAPLRR